MLRSGCSDAASLSAAARAHQVRASCRGQAGRLGGAWSVPLTQLVNLPPLQLAADDESRGSEHAVRLCAVALCGRSRHWQDHRRPRRRRGPHAQGLGRPTGCLILAREAIKWIRMLHRRGRRIGSAASGPGSARVFCTRYPARQYKEPPSTLHRATLRPASWALRSKRGDAESRCARVWPGTEPLCRCACRKACVGSRSERRLHLCGCVSLLSAWCGALV